MLFSSKIYSKIKSKGKNSVNEFDDIFFKSILLYQAVVLKLNENQKEVVIFKNKKLNEAIQKSLSDIYNVSDDFFNLLFEDLFRILSSKNLKISNLGILSLKNDNIEFLII